MPQETTTIAIPVTLRDLIATHAGARGVSREALADSGFKSQLQVARAMLGRGERLADHYLTDPRITSAGQSAPTVHISGEADQAAQDLAEAIGREVGRRIPKGRVIQALLWAELEPLPPTAQRVNLPEPPTLDMTVNVPGALNTALIELGLRWGATREAVVDILLTQATSDLEEMSAADLLALSNDPRIQPSDGRGKVTIRVPRHYDPQLAQLADRSFQGVRSYALQALLWRGLDGAKDDPAVELPDRTVAMNGRLYARLAQYLFDKRGDSRPLPTMKRFVETAVERELDRELRRQSRPAQKSADER
jgi:hypothetical protein